jgi:hydrogenase maturation protein HypF
MKNGDRKKNGRLSGDGPAAPDSTDRLCRSTDRLRRSTGRLRRRLEVRGRVQGVGFRPFVFRLAGDLSLGGLVGNDTQGVFIEVEGPAPAVDGFTERLTADLPPLARINSLRAREIPLCRDGLFRIAASETGTARDTQVTPDTALCADCRDELFDRANRRYRYPFINCTNCGPRYSIIRTVPYDRPATTMAPFAMCPACRDEYEAPADRRFHAQPIACPACGPRVRLLNSRGEGIDGDPFAECAVLLRAGKIVAIKGLGGFHLACAAGSDRAVAVLRERKGREAKPFALMVGSLEEARAIAHVEESAAAAMATPAAPIVLVAKKEDAAVSGLVAPGSRCLGIMLPNTPLHALLLGESPGPLVLTSANPSGEPLCHDNDEALHRLSGMADAFLVHDRGIERPVDDSVALAVSLPGRPGRKKDGERTGTTGKTEGDGVIILRRARGYVPDPIDVDTAAPRPILAVGGELKSAVCFLSGGSAVLSEHLGELSNARAYRNFIRAVDRLKILLDTEPELVACDSHPDYAATRYARSLGLPLVEVQHHHAHIMSCLADNGFTGPVIGIACDGTGYGEDGSIWGCELLLCRGVEFSRAGCLKPFPLPGGDAAARDTWRPAAGLLHETFGAEWPGAVADFFDAVDPEAVALIAARLAGPATLPLTSSLGRLFDAAAFLLGLCDRNRFEAEAPMALETAAWKGRDDGEPLPLPLLREGRENPLTLDPRPLITAIVEGRRAGRSAPDLARAFHEAIAEALCNAAIGLSEAHGIGTVALSGGCFANHLLLRLVVGRLRKTGLAVLRHKNVPPGDGGIALGQALVAAAGRKVPTPGKKKEII